MLYEQLAKVFMKLDLAKTLNFQNLYIGSFIHITHASIRMLLTPVLLVQEFACRTCAALDFNAVVFHQKAAFAGPLFSPWFLQNLALDNSTFFNKFPPSLNRVFG